MDDSGQRVQSVFTVVAPVRRERVGALQTVLDEIAADPGGNGIFPLGRLPGLHYASLVLFPARSDREPLLVFESNVDGSIADHLGRVADLSPGVGRVWGECVEFPSSGAADGEVRAWLHARVVLPGAYHVGTTDRSRSQVEREVELRGAIEEHVDAERAGGTLPGSASAIRAAITAHLEGQPQLAWALRPARAATRAEVLRKVVHIAASSDRSLVGPIAAGAGGLVVLGRRSPARALLALAAGAGGAVAWLRWREAVDPAEDAPVPDELLDAIEGSEDRIGSVTNHLASLVDLKPGVGRRTLLRSILLVIDVAGRLRYTKGELGGIASIHYAHWSIVDRGRRLLFVSNYDGSWESYLDEFIEQAASGLTAVWSNTRDFPRCRWLGLPAHSGGARHGPAFKRIARNSQAPTTIHFAAYPALSVANIRRNTALRLGLVGELDEEGAQAWLSNL